MASTILMLDPWTLAAAAICGAVSLRIVCWKPRGEQYKLAQSLAAWFMAACTGAYSMQVALYTLYARPVAAVSPMIVLILLMVAVQVFRARGNVASFFRVEWSNAPWSGIERRRSPR